MHRSIKLLLLVACLVGCSESRETQIVSEQTEKVPSVSNATTEIIPNDPKKFKISTINASEIIRGVKLGKMESGESGNGRTRIRWSLNERDKLEIIGNDQSDADVVAWQCNTFDKAGKFLMPAEGSVCFKFFESVLSNVVYSPRDVANSLIFKAVPNENYAKISGNNILIETDGSLFFIRNEDHK